jgi:exopolysaccharide production protein ExoQ
MPRAIATLVFYAVIAVLFWLDRDQKSRTSAALWLPVTWFLIACSRTASYLLNLSQGGHGWTTAQLEEGNPVDRAIFTGLLLLGLMVLVQRREQVLKILRQSAPILMFFGLCLLSFVWSDFPGVAFKRWNKALGDWVMIMIVLTEPQPLMALKRLLARTAYPLIPLSILFIKYYPDIGRSYGRWLGEVHYLGVTTDKNSLGAICLLFGVASVWRIADLFSDPGQRKYRTRRVLAQCVILAMIGWLFSILDAMTSLSCFVLTTCLLFVNRFRVFARHRGLVHVVVLAMILITASIAFLGLSPGALQAMGRNATLTERTDIWAEVIKLVPNRWIGAGYESFWLGPRLDTMIAEVTRWWVPNQSHNGYLEIYANLGWVGIGCLAVVLFWGYRRIIGAWRQKLGGSDLMLSYFVAGVIFNFTEAAFFRMTAPVWMFLLYALTFPQATRNYRRVHRVIPAYQIEEREIPTASVEAGGETVSVQDAIRLT